MSYSLWQMIRYFLRLGTLGFGGPVALVGNMHRDLVEQRQWITEADYKEGLALAQLAPGPLAAQLAIYLGYVHHRILGATLAGLAFVLPSFVMVAALGWAYTHFGGIPWMQAVFYGVGAAVIGIIAMSAKKLTEKSVGKDKLLWALYLLLAIVTVVTESEVAWLFIAAGGAGVVPARATQMAWAFRHAGCRSIPAAAGSQPDWRRRPVLAGATRHLLHQGRGLCIRLGAGDCAFPVWRRGD